jgi:hypothetical protein
VETTPQEGFADGSVSRRTALKAGGITVAAAGTLEMLGKLAFKPARAGAAGAELAADPQAITANLPDIQHNIGPFLGGGAHAPQTINGVRVQFGPVFTVMSTWSLLRTPNRADQAEMARALDTIENTWAFGPSGVFVFVAYGTPYFNRLPAGLVASAIPRLTKDTSRFAFEEAIPSPTDVRASAPNIRKQRFNVPVRIETNGVLFTLRSDNQAILSNIINWFNGSNTLNGRAVRSPAWGGLLRNTSNRVMFQQNGLPKQVANQNNLVFRNFINPQSPMWMGFADQQVDSSGPPEITTFIGNASDRGRTTARAGDYFDRASTIHLSHVLMDMMQFFDIPDGSATPGDDGVFTERVQYMFTSPAINRGNADQLTNGGGPAFLNNVFKGTGEAARTAQGIGTDIDPETGQGERRIGHEAALQRSSRAADGTPIHIRMDGAGFDNMDVPGGGNLAKLQFLVFTPTSDSFSLMRRNGAAVDLADQFGVDEDENGLERFLTTTRRQNFLSPPRRHRAFPLAEFT